MDFAYWNEVARHKLELMNYLLKKVVHILNAKGIKYYLDCGTLIGCVRDKDLIISDTDVDITTHLSQWGKLKKINFEKYDLIKIKAHEHYPKKKWGNMISIKTKWAELYCDVYANPAFPKLEEVKMNEEIYTIPIESELYLDQLYGNWKVPSGSHADTTFHRNRGLVESEYSKYWDTNYKIFECNM